MRPEWMEHGTNEDAETRSVRVMKQGITKRANQRSCNHADYDVIAHFCVLVRRSWGSFELKRQAIAAETTKPSSLPLSHTSYLPNKPIHQIQPATHFNYPTWPLQHPPAPSSALPTTCFPPTTPKSISPKTAKSAPSLVQQPTTTTTYTSTPPCLLTTRSHHLLQQSARH